MKQQEQLPMRLLQTSQQLYTIENYSERDASRQLQFRQLSVQD